MIVDERVEDLAPLRQLLVGGDVLSVPHVLRAAAALSGGRVINGYGPTENTTFTCCHTIQRGRDYRSGIPIGTPIANSTAYILDRCLRPVPTGVPGELFTGGDGLSHGYLNRPDAHRRALRAESIRAGRAVSHRRRGALAARW